MAEAAQRHGGRIPFRPDIEGMRGIAVLLVVLYHAGAAGFAGGFVGVDVFFVVSGYLITQLLLRELEVSGSIDLMAFYARRIRRLLPAAALVTVTTLVAGAVLYAPMAQVRLANTALATSAYVSNLFFAVTATDYMGVDASTNPLLHMWSLSVEEQFYIAWPLLMMLAAGTFARARGPVHLRRLRIVIVLGSAASLVIGIWLTRTYPTQAFYLPQARAWEFGVGGLAGLTSLSIRPSVRVGFSFVTLLLGWIGVALIALAVALYTGGTPFPGTTATMPVVGAALVLVAGEALPSSGLRRVLEAPPLRWIGRLAYSWYLWHWPGLMFATAIAGELSVLASLLVVLGALGLAALTYSFVENPLRYSRRLSGRSVWTIAMGVGLTCACVATAGTWRSLAPRLLDSPQQGQLATAANDLPSYFAIEGCHSRDYHDAALGVCSFGDVDATRTVVLFGDSHAAHWFPAVLEIAENANMRLVPITKAGCPAVMVPPDPAGGRAAMQACVEWREQAYRYIEDTDPALVILANYGGYRTDDATWELAVRNALDRLSNQADRVVYVLDTPDADFNVLECLADGAWRAAWLPRPECSFPRAASVGARYEIEERATRRFDNVQLIELNRSVCPDAVCSGRRGDLIVFRDDNHLTATFARTLAPAFAAALGRDLADAR